MHALDMRGTSCYRNDVKHWSISLSSCHAQHLYCVSRLVLYTTLQRPRYMQSWTTACRIASQRMLRRFDDMVFFHSGYVVSLRRASCDADCGPADSCLTASSPVSFGLRTPKLKHFSASAMTISSALLAVARNAHRISPTHEPFEMALLVMMSTIVRATLV